MRLSGFQQFRRDSLVQRRCAPRRSASLCRSFARALRRRLGGLAGIPSAAPVRIKASHSSCVRILRAERICLSERRMKIRATQGAPYARTPRTIGAKSSALRSRGDCSDGGCAEHDGIHQPSPGPVDNGPRQSLALFGDISALDAAAMAQGSLGQFQGPLHRPDFVRPEAIWSPIFPSHYSQSQKPEPDEEFLTKRSNCNIFDYIFAIHVSFSLRSFPKH